MLSNFNYCDYLYGFCLDTESRMRIQRVQNSCLRLVYDIKKYDHISQFYKRINWLKMDERTILHFCTFLLKLVNDPSSPQSLKQRLIFRQSIHNFNIRIKDKLTMPLHQSAMFQRCFSYNAVNYYNKIPSALLNLNINKLRRVWLCACYGIRRGRKFLYTSCKFFKNLFQAMVERFRP